MTDHPRPDAEEPAIVHEIRAWLSDREGGPNFKLWPKSAYPLLAHLGSQARALPQALRIEEAMTKEQLDELERLEKERHDEH